MICLLSGHLVFLYLVGGHHQLSEEDDGVVDLFQLVRWSKLEALQVQDQYSVDRKKRYEHQVIKYSVTNSFYFYSSQLLSVEPSLITLGKPVSLLGTVVRSL